MSAEQGPTRTAARSAGRAWVAPSPGDRIGRYRLVREIGRGGMGAVFEAHDTVLDRAVALKLLVRGREADDDQVRRFVTEARAASQLDHPAIVSVLDVGQTDEHVFFAMDLVPGRSLGSVLRDDGVLEPRRAFELLLQVARALEHAHARGIIHRDVKPENILVDPRGAAHLVDFGLARQTRDPSTLTAPGEFVGTLAYASPEHLRGAAVDPRSDIYSLGVTLFECLAGRRPHAETEHDFGRLLWEIENAEPPAIRVFRPSLPADVELVIAKCLEIAPEHRYASAAELAVDMERVLRGARPAARPQRVRRLVARVRRHWPRFAAAVLAVLALAAAVVGWSHARATARIRREQLRRAELARTVGDLTVDERLAVWNRVLEIDPGFWEGHVERARLLRRLASERRRLRDPEGARAAALAARRELALARVLDSEGPRPPLLLIDAEICRRLLRDPAAAADIYRELVARAPDSPEGLYARARLALEAADVRDAEAAVRRALELSPALAPAHYLDGEVAIARGQFRRAVAALDAIHGPWWVFDDPERFILRARAFELLGDTGKATTDLEHVLELDPLCEETRGRLEALRQ